MNSTAGIHAHSSASTNRNTQRATRESHLQVGTTNPDVTGNRDLGPAADRVTVAGSNRRLGKLNHGVVEVGKLLHPGDPPLLVEFLLDVGAGREAAVVS